MKKVQNKKFDGSKNKKVDKTSSKNISYQPKIYNFNIIALAGFIIPLILLVFSYDYFGSFFEMNDDPRYVMAMKGFASPVPYNNFVSVYIFTSDLYIWLYKQALQIPWYGLSMFIMLWGALFNIFIAIYLIACKRINLTGIILIFLADRKSVV